MSRRKLILLLCVSISASFTFAPRSTKSNPEPMTSVKPQAATLIINEYLADPATGAAGNANGDLLTDPEEDEFVELVNTGSVPLNIGGFTISDATSVRFTFLAGTTIPPGEATVVFGGGTPTGDFGNASANMLVFKTTTAVGLSLTNGGDSIIVKDSIGNEVIRHDYPPPVSDVNEAITRSPDITGSFVRHSTAAGSGGTLFSPGARVNGRPFVTDDPLINSISPDFVIAGSGTVMVTVSGDKFQNGAQVRIDGTPIATTFNSANQLDAQVPPMFANAPAAYLLDVQNPDTVLSNEVAFTVFAQVGINEFLADPPTGPTGDANGDGVTSSTQDEFVEVVNRTSTPLAIGGFSISDDAAVRFTFPPGTILPANEAAVVFGGGSPTGDFGNAAINGLIFTATLSLNNTGDTITLKDSGGNPIEEIDYGSEGGMDQSLNRNPEIVGVNFSLHSLINPSKLFSPGTTTDGAPFTTGPRITEIAPDRVPVGSPPFDLTVRGSGFEMDSTVLIDHITFPAQLIAGDLIVTVPVSVTSVAGAHSVEVRNAGGNRSNAVTLVIVPPPPSLFLVLPRQVVAGGPSFTMFLVGANFDPASTVLIDDSVITPQFLSLSELRITVTAAMIATPGSRRVRVRNGDGLISNETTFDVVLPLARITRLSPGQAITGSPAFTLTVTGASFRNGSAILFDQTLLVTRFVSATELQTEVPSSLINAPGLRSVTVQNDDGALSNDAVFLVLPDAPLISSIQPRSVIEGSGDTVITIMGVKFQRGVVARLIENSRSGARLQTTFISAERLEVMLPAAFVRAPGRVSFIVENPDFGISNTVALDVLIKDPLVVNEYLADPPEGAAGDANADGTRSSSQDEFIEIVNRTSAPIDLSGYKLFDSEAVRHVFANGTIIPPKEAAVVFGGGSPSGRFGNAAENKLVFAASTGGLSLANTGDAIRLEDNQSRVVQEIRFGAAEGGASQSINRSPDIDGAAFALHALVAGGRLFSPGTKATGETFTIKPSISSLMPSSARVGSSAFTLKVSGENFLPDAVVFFGQTELVTVHRSASELEAQVTAGMIAEGGAIEVRVRNPEGETSASVRFLITDDPPVIEAITPASTGTGAENFEITIEGRRFQRGAQAIIENETVETRFISSGEITASVPDRFFTRAADIQIRVKNTDGNLSNAAKLAVENGPLITRLSRKKIKAGRGDAEITIGGVAFKSGVRLLVNGVEVPTSFTSETEFSARIPGAMTAAPAQLTIQALNPDGGRSNRAAIRVVD